MRRGIPVADDRRARYEQQRRRKEPRPAGSESGLIEWLVVRPVDERQLRFSPWDASRVTQKVAESGELSLGGLIDLATENWKLRRGDVRLIGRSEAAMPGMEIRPTAAQEERHTMFLVHLQRGAWNEPRPDVNCKLDYVDEIFPDDPAPLGGASDPLAPAAQPESGLGTGKLPGT